MEKQKKTLKERQLRQFLIRFKEKQMELKYGSCKSKSVSGVTDVPAVTCLEVEQVKEDVTPQKVEEVMDLTEDETVEKTVMKEVVLACTPQEVEQVKEDVTPQKVEEVIDLTEDEKVEKTVMKEVVLACTPQEVEQDEETIIELKLDNTQPESVRNGTDIPAFTFRPLANLINWNTQRLGQLRIQPMNINNIMNNTSIIRQRPLLYRFEGLEFSAVQISGKITTIEPTTTFKTVITIDDGHPIKVFINNRNEKFAKREQLKELINKTAKIGVMKKAELLRHIDMSTEEYHSSVTQPEEDNLMNTLTHILACKLHAKLEAQFPRPLAWQMNVEVIGRLLPRVPNEIYDFNNNNPYTLYAYHVKQIMTPEEFILHQHNVFQELNSN